MFRRNSKSVGFLDFSFNHDFTTSKGAASLGRPHTCHPGSHLQTVHEPALTLIPSPELGEAF